MKIGLLLPSLLASKRFPDRIFAPKPLFESLANGLVDRGHDVYVYAPKGVATKATLINGDVLLEEKELGSVKIRQMKEGQVLYRLNASEYEMDLGVKAFLHAQANGIEVMHLYIDSIVHYIAHLSQINTVTTLHDPPFSQDTLEGWRYFHFSKDPHVAISQRQADLYGPRFNIVGVVHHGVDVSTFPFSAEGRGYLTFVGRLIKEKGIEDAMEVSQQTKIPIHIATSNNYFDTDYYKNNLQEKLAGELVTMTGYLDKARRDDWIKNARCLLFPIHWAEPFGMVMIEAMACGTPVIAYNRGSVPEIVKDGVTGFIVEPEDENSKLLPEFAYTVTQAGKTQNTKQIQNKKFQIQKTGIKGLVEAVQRIGEIDRQACRQHVAENFTVEKMVEGYERVYDRIVSNRV